MIIVEGTNCTNKFKVGDKVRVFAITTHENDNKFFSNLEKIGIVTRVIKEFYYSYYVDFGENTGMLFNEATLELIKE